MIALLLATILAVPATSRANWTTDPTVNLPVCTAAGDQWMTTMLPDGYGGAWVAWSDTRVSPSHADIYVHHILASGVVDPSWPADGLPVCTAWSAQTSPAIVTDGGSGILVGWWDQRISASNPDLYLQRVLPTGTVDPSWPANGAPVVTSLNFQYPPFVMSDGAGGAFFCFGQIGATNNVYAQHMIASGDRDPAWSEFGLKLTVESGTQFGPTAVSDGAGGMLVGWGDERPYVGGAYVSRVLVSGSVHPAWPDTGRALCGPPIDIGSVKLVPDGFGGAIVVWSDKRASSLGDIYAHHVLADGTVDPTWPANGRAVCTAANEQVVPKLVSDGNHGAVVVWWDRRSGDYDLYAHHILATGIVDPSWPADGRAVVTGPGDQMGANILPDGTGGVLCVWHDGRSGATTRDIYATRILASGIVDPAWPENGLAVCSASGNQIAPAVCTDGTGGLIAAWSDQRSGNDIYAQRVTATGALPNVGADDSSPSELRLEAPRPNPALRSTLLRLSLPDPQRVRLDVHDVGGRLVRRLADDALPAGRREFRWDLDDDEGGPVPPGLYLIRLVTSRQVQTSRVVVLGR